MKWIIIIFFALSLVSNAQNNALILNNQVAVTINAGAVLTVNQTNAAGISRIGTANGVIISEAELNRVAWIISNGTGSFNIPFGKTDLTQIPMIYAITVAGSTPGTLIASTYPTAAANNTAYPTVAPAVTSVDACYIAGACEDRSLYAVDRFWILRKNADWATNPTSNVTFTYADNEWAGPNTITEANLQAQYWTAAQWNPGWWLGVPILGTNDAANNQVDAANAGSAANLYTWILVDNTKPLPIELLSFDVRCAGQLATISWATASETNNAGFTLERSKDGFNWEWVNHFSGAGNSNVPLFYTYNDDVDASGGLMYRLTQTDFDGTSAIVGTKSIQCQDNNSNPQTTFGLNLYSDQDHQVFATFTTIQDEEVILSILDARGRLIIQQKVQAFAGNNNVKLEFAPLADAIYMVMLQSSSLVESKKIILQ